MFALTFLTINSFPVTHGCSIVLFPSFAYRAEVIIGGFIIDGVTDDPPVCKVTFVTRADLKGEI